MSAGLTQTRIDSVQWRIWELIFTKTLQRVVVRVRIDTTTKYICSQNEPALQHRC
jgi:hypothetical protein